MLARRDLLGARDQLLELGEHGRIARLTFGPGPGELADALGHFQFSADVVFHCSLPGGSRGVAPWLDAVNIIDSAPRLSVDSRG